MRLRIGPVWLLSACVALPGVAAGESEESARLPRFDLSEHAEYALFTSMLVTTGPFFTATDETSTGLGAQERQVVDDAAAFVASEGRYRTAALEAALRAWRIQAGPARRDELDLAHDLLVSSRR